MEIKTIRIFLLGIFILLGLIVAIGGIIGFFLHMFSNYSSDCSMNITADNNTVRVLEETYKIMNLTHSGKSFNDFPKGRYNDSVVLLCSVKVFYYETGELNVPDYYEYPVTLEYYEFPCYSEGEVKNN